MDQDMLNKRFVIYGFENKINHKMYIGQTQRTLKERIKQHLRDDLCVDLSIKKYGIGNFHVIVLEECKTLEELNEREIYWIKRLNCKTPNGYNRTDGGEGSKGYTHTSEEISKNAFKRAVRCVETGEIFPSIKSAAAWANGSSACILYACKNGTKSAGYHWRYVDNASRGYTHRVSNKNRKKRAVHCVEKNITFESIAAVAAWIGAPTSNIIGACKNPQKTVKGYHFFYVGEPCFNEEKCKRISTKNSKPVLCVETGIIYPSSIAAAEAIGTQPWNINAVCRGEQRTSGGYHWRRVTDDQSASVR